MVFITNPNTADFVWGNDGIGGGGRALTLAWLPMNVMTTPPDLDWWGFQWGGFWALPSWNPPILTSWLLGNFVPEKWGC